MGKCPPPPSLSAAVHGPASEFMRGPPGDRCCASCVRLQAPDDDLSFLDPTPRPAREEVDDLSFLDPAPRPTHMGVGDLSHIDPHDPNPLPVREEVDNLSFLDPTPAAETMPDLPQDPSSLPPEGTPIPVCLCVWSSVCSARRAQEVSNFLDTSGYLKFPPFFHRKLGCQLLKLMAP